MKFGRNQVIGCSVIAAGMVVSTVLTCAGRLTGTDWVAFNSDFLPWMCLALFGGSAATKIAPFLRRAPRSVGFTADTPEMP